MQQTARRALVVSTLTCGLLLLAVWQLFPTLIGWRAAPATSPAPAEARSSGIIAAPAPERPPDPLDVPAPTDPPPDDLPAPAVTAAVGGRLVTAAQRTAVADCRIEIRDRRGQVLASGHSAADGGFLLGAVPPGYHAIEFAFRDDHLHTDPLPIHITRGERLELGPIPVFHGAVVRGRVVDGQTGAVVTAARVVGYQPGQVRSGADASLVALSTADGQFRMSGPFVPGELILSATAPRHASRSPPLRLTVADEDLLDVEVLVYPTFDLAGAVRDVEGTRVDARIEVVGGGRSLCCTDATADGTFVIGDVLGGLGMSDAADFGQLFVRASSPRHLPAIAETTVAQVKAGAPVEIVLDRGATIRGRCLTLAGNPLVDVPVIAYPAGDDRYGQVRTTRTDHAGAFELGGLAAGATFVEPAARVATLVPDLRRQQRRLNGLDLLEDVVFTYREGLPIAGMALDVKDGQPLVDRLVTLHHEDWLYPQETLTDQRGGFRFPALADGRYTVALRGQSWEERRPPVLLEAVAAGVESLRFEVDEEAEDGVIELRLVDARSGMAVTQRAACELRHYRFDLAHRQTLVVTPDADGTTVFDHLARAWYRLDVGVPGYAAARADIGLDASRPEVQHTLYLTPAIHLHGRITDSRGTPIAGAWARAFTDPGPGELLPGAGAVTDRDGRFTIRDAAHDATALLAGAAGFAALRTDLPPGGATQFHSLALTPGAPLAGVAVFADGTPAAMLDLVLVGAVATQYTTTDLAGRFAFDHVEDGPFDVQRGDGEVLGSGEIVAGQGLFVELPL